MKVQPYLFYEGRCEEALDFYKGAIGAQVTMLMRVKDSPDPAMCPPGNDDKILHASFTVGESTVMASDGQISGHPNFQGVSLSIYAADAAEAEELFAALADGGQVRMPLTKTFFSPAFGMLADRFGVGWMVMVDAQP